MQVVMCASVATIMSNISAFGLNNLFSGGAVTGGEWAVTFSFIAPAAALAGVATGLQGMYNAVPGFKQRVDWLFGGLVNAMQKAYDSYQNWLAPVGSVASSSSSPPAVLGSYFSEMAGQATPAELDAGFKSMGLPYRSAEGEVFDQEINRTTSRLNYSERTVKNVLHGLMMRLQLRNRPHVVAYAARHGYL